ncbi:MAG: hypothetical protein NC300_05980 [Bacteroidales bacterium]|nr:hypothetical protein [Clostridium sp.]MCM1203672.1 hypothetical protein [Bacteroidales bacterium]
MPEAEEAMTIQKLKDDFSNGKKTGRIDFRFLYALLRLYFILSAYAACLNHTDSHFLPCLILLSAPLLLPLRFSYPPTSYIWLQPLSHL